MKKILCCLPSLAVLLALAGCCANDSCNCEDELADALYFKINYTTHRQYQGSKAISFSASDVDTIRFYRTTRSPSSPADTLGDSVTVARHLTIVRGDTLISDTVQVTTQSGTYTRPDQDILILNNTSPFTFNGSNKLNAYNYRVAVIRNRSKSRKPLASYRLTDIQLQGNYQANGCCTCYHNTSKSYTLRIGSRPGTPVIATDVADSLRERRVVRLPYPG